MFPPSAWLESPLPYSVLARLARVEVVRGTHGADPLWLSATPTRSSLQGRSLAPFPRSSNLLLPGLRLASSVPATHTLRNLGS